MELEIDKKFIETPDTIHGRLLETVHISGYTMERACIGLDWLLTKNRWMKVGDGFDDINIFLETINLSKFKIAVDKRKKLSTKLSEMQATQRATAKAIGVSPMTINSDLKKDVHNRTNIDSNDGNNGNLYKQDVQNCTKKNTVLTKDGKEILKPIENKNENELAKEDRILEESELRKKDIKDIEIRKGDFKKVLADVYNIDAIITDPPYPKEYINCFSELSLYAKEHLKDGGFCVVYSGQFHIPEVIKRLSENLTYVWTFCLYHSGKTQLVNGVNIMCGWKPIFVFSKGNKKMRFTASDIVVSEKMEKASHKWQQSESGVKNLIEIFTKPTDLIVDPFAGSGTFLKVANELKRNAIGAEINE